MRIFFCQSPNLANSRIDSTFTCNKNLLVAKIKTQMAVNNEQIEQITGIILKEFSTQKQGNKVNQHFFGYWTKVKGLMPATLIESLEQNPEAEETKATLIETYIEKFKNQRFIAHTAMFVNQYELK